MIVISIATGLAFVGGCCKCKTGEPTTAPAEVAPVPTAETADAPPKPQEQPGAGDGALASAQRVEAVYRMDIPFGPCSSRLTKLVKQGESYTSEQRCEDPEWKPKTWEITREEFEKQVLIAVRLGDASLGYGEVPLDAVKGAPDGTTKCYQTPEGAHTACQNADGITTIDAFDGYKLDPPKMDANRGSTLVSYTVE
jgi:hypothetical protein